MTQIAAPNSRTREDFLTNQLKKPLFITTNNQQTRSQLRLLRTEHQTQDIKNFKTFNAKGEHKYKANAAPTTQESKRKSSKQFSKTKDKQASQEGNPTLKKH